MLKNFYNFLITTKFTQLNLFDFLEIAEKHGRVYANKDADFDIDGRLSMPEIENDEPCFIHVDGADIETCVAIYENLLFTFSVDETLNDRIIRIYMKKPEDAWQFEKNTSDGKHNLLKPCNVNAEIYVNYNVSVLRLNRCVGENYKSGAWNKMFYKTLELFCKKVQGYTEINQLKKAYEK